METFIHIANIKIRAIFPSSIVYKMCISVDVFWNTVCFSWFMKQKSVSKLQLHHISVMLCSIDQYYIVHTLCGTTLLDGVVYILNAPLLNTTCKINFNSDTNLCNAGLNRAISVFHINWAVSYSTLTVYQLKFLICLSFLLFDESFAIFNCT